MEIDEIEDIVRTKVAQQIIETLPESERRKILEASLVKTLKDVLSSYQVEKAIKNDVERYMVEYIQNPEVQERIKKATFESMNKLMQGVINVIISRSQDGIKSDYAKFVEKSE